MSPVWVHRWLPLVLLLSSNVFMTFAWYGHLKYRSAPIWLAIVASWGIAFFEYVPDGPRQPDRLCVLYRDAVEDYPGGDYADGVQRLSRSCI